MRRLDVSTVSVVEEHGALTVGFADHADLPRHWLLLQRMLKPTKQDRDLGQDQVHLSNEVNAAGVYGGVIGAAVSPQQVTLRLSNEARDRLKCDEELIVGIEGAQVDYPKLIDAVKRVLHPVPVSTAER